MRLAMLFLVALAAFAQSPTGTVQVASTITATAGTLVCTGTATVAASTSTMHFKCMEGSVVVLPDIDFTVAAPGSTTYTVQRGQNNVGLILTKGNPVPDQWQITANGVMKSGTF